MSVADLTAEGDIEILGIDRDDAHLTRPSGEEKIVEGDRLLVYANRKSIRPILHWLPYREGIPKKCLDITLGEGRPQS